jgi:hypothetical protein
MKKNNNLFSKFYKVFFISSLFILSFFSNISFLNSSFAQEEKKEELVEEEVFDKIDTSRFYSIAVIQALDKTTARTSILQGKIKEKIKFGKLKIIAHKCWQSPADQKPESKILLEVFEEENKNGEIVDKRIFYGWMFASSPSISGVEHPVYDLSAVGCKNK